LKLHVSVDASEDSDPQSHLFEAASEAFGPILEEELSSFQLGLPEKEAELSVVFMDSAEIREINRNHRDTDEPTDVLAFPMWEGKEEASVFSGTLADCFGLPVPLGDILICPEQVRRFHASLPYIDALCLVLAHGFLHLLGWDHDTGERENAMWARQDALAPKLRKALPREENRP
jgi:probable rRNA maturation factor